MTIVATQGTFSLGLLAGLLMAAGMVGYRIADPEDARGGVVWWEVWCGVAVAGVAAAVRQIERRRRRPR